VNNRDLLRAAQREQARLRGIAQQKGIRFDAGPLCHDAGRKYVKTRGKRNAVRTPRRVGKTVHEGLRLLDGVFDPPYGNQLYVTDTLKNAKRRVWPTIRKLNQKLGLGGVLNETEAFIKFSSVPNEPHIFLGGAKDQNEIDKIRGYEGGFKRVIIDEAQSIRQSIMTELVDDVIEPSLMDYNGELDVVGTPGPIAAGYFYDIDVGDAKDGWEHFFWTIADNPFLAEKSGVSTEKYLSDLRARRNWTEETPAYVRQYLGQWVTDADALAFHYLASRNACDWQFKPEPGWHYILCFDIGFDDADAIAVLGWAPHDRRLRLVKEVITRKQGITELGNQLKSEWITFKPMACIGDLGALGKKIGEELKLRWQIPVEAADKQRKAEHVALLDDALITGQFLAPVNSVFAEDCDLVQWDPDAKAKGILTFCDVPHSDIADAVLYGFRHSYHWLEKAEPPPKTIFDSPILKAMLANPNPDRPKYE